MLASDRRSAIETARLIASMLGLRADDATVLHDSNRLTVRLLPCDVLARVATADHEARAAFELEVARWLCASTSPVAAPDPRVDPRVYVRDGFAVTLWTYYEPVPPRELEPAEHAGVLARLHAGLRTVTVPAPHFTDRVAEAQHIVDTRARSPELSEADRAFLGATLRELRGAIRDGGAAEQLLHGEPHPGNVLRTVDGLLFVDFETCCRGPVEFDVAGMPEAAGKHYPHLDRALLDACRVLTLALVAAWRWDVTDRFPKGQQMGVELLKEIRSRRACLSI